MGKKLVRGTPWIQKDFYFGVQLCLATLSADLLYLFELGRAADTPELHRQILTAIGFVVVLIASYIWLLTLHQDWESKSRKDPKGCFLRLMVVSNLSGVVLFAAFVYLVKGIR